MLAETSADSLLWERDARYQYYKHGPLARLRLGDQLVQGVDYAYTLQGWLKGVNGTSLDSTYDMGLDGRPGENQYVARDAYGFVLNYYSGDYNNISALYKPFPGFSSQLNSEYRPLFNGNISSQAVNIPRLGAPLLYNYRYDQLNRLVAQDGYSGLNPAANRWDTLILSPAYRERIAYDANGNILKYLRNGLAANPAMDSLQYDYPRDGQGRLLNNQLLRVRDSVGASNYAIDIDNQPLNNYAYDPIGNLVKDSAENISSISWNVYGKITEIQKTATASNPVVDIKYFYDAAGNRIGKAVKLAGSDSLAYSWYVRDASGNVMALYESRGLDTGYSHYNLFLTEQHLYGSSRLGLLKRKVDLTPGNGVLQNSRFIRGNKFFELSNHLGNVLATISDKKTGVSTDDSTVAWYRPELITAQDYYPFGMLMPGRSGASTRSGSPADETGSTVPPASLDITSRSGNSPVIYQALTSISFEDGFASSSTDAFETIIGDQYTGGGATGGSWLDGSSGYRYGFNGKEQDPDTYGQGNEYDYGFRIYNPRLGKFLSVDPLQKKYPWFTPFQFAGNSPIGNIDLDGLEDINYNLVESKNSDGKPTLDIVFDNRNSINVIEDIYRLNAYGQTDLYNLYYHGTLLAQFTSFQDLKVISHGKTPGQIKDIGIENLESGLNRVLALHAMAELMKEPHNPANSGRNTFQNQIPQDEEDESEISRGSSNRSVTPTKITNKQAKRVTNNSNPEVSNNEASEWKGPVDYSKLKEPNTVGPGRETTSAQRKRILNYNKKMNGGVLRSDIDGTVLDPPVNVPRGARSNMNQAEVDHIEERGNMGSNSNRNLRVVSKKQNLQKESQRRKK